MLRYIFPKLNYICSTRLLSSTIKNNEDLKRLANIKQSKINWGLNILEPPYSYIIERFGSYHRTVEAGIHFLYPLIDKIVFMIDMREHLIDIEPFEITTIENIKVKINPEFNFRYKNAQSVAYYATSPLESVINHIKYEIKDKFGNIELNEINKQKRSICERISTDKFYMENLGCEVSNIHIKKFEPVDEDIKLNMNNQIILSYMNNEKKVEIEKEELIVKIENTRKSIELENKVREIKEIADAEEYRMKKAIDLNIYNINQKIHSLKSLCATLEEISPGITKNSKVIETVVLKSVLQDQIPSQLRLPSGDPSGKSE